MIGLPYVKTTAIGLPKLDASFKGPPARRANPAWPGSRLPAHGGGLARHSRSTSARPAASRAPAAAKSSTGRCPSPEGRGAGPATSSRPAPLLPPHATAQAFRQPRSRAAPPPRASQALPGAGCHRDFAEGQPTSAQLPAPDRGGSGHPGRIASSRAKGCSKRPSRALRSSTRITAASISASVTSPGLALPAAPRDKRRLPCRSTPAFKASAEASTMSAATPCEISSATALKSLTMTPLKPWRTRSQSRSSPLWIVIGTPARSVNAGITVLRQPRPPPRMAGDGLRAASGSKHRQGRIRGRPKPRHRPRNAWRRRLWRKARQARLPESPGPLPQRNAKQAMGPRPGFRDPPQRDRAPHPAWART